MNISHTTEQQLAVRLAYRGGFAERVKSLMGVFAIGRRSIEVGELYQLKCTGPHIDGPCLCVMTTLKNYKKEDRNLRRVRGQPLNRDKIKQVRASMV